MLLNLQRKRFIEKYIEKYILKILLRYFILYGERSMIKWREFND